MKFWAWGTTPFVGRGEPAEDVDDDEAKEEDHIL